MESKKVNAIWSISLFIIGVATFILVGANVIGLELSDIAIRILGLMEIIAFLFLGFSTVRKFKNSV